MFIHNDVVGRSFREAAPPVYAQARCYPNANGYRVDLVPCGGAAPGPGWPTPRWFHSLGDAMAWAYAMDGKAGIAIHGLSLMSERTATGGV